MSGLELRTQPVEKFLGAPANLVNARAAVATGGAANNNAQLLREWRTSVDVARAAEFRKKYAHRVGVRWSLNLHAKSGACVFLENRRCSIYSDRPRQCRSWPFWNEVKDDAALRAMVLRTCPGIVEFEGERTN